MIVLNYKALATLRINLIIQLNSLFIAYGGKAMKITQHSYIQNLLNKGHKLFTLNFLALKGVNKLDEITALLMDILADIYFITQLKGFTRELCITLDNMCDTLLNYDADLGNLKNED